MNCLYLIAHILDIWVTLEYLLQVSQPYTLFKDQPSFCNFLTCIFTLDLDSFPKPVLHELIHMADSQNNIITEGEDVGDLYITLPQEHISSDSFWVTLSTKTVNFIWSEV